MSCWFQINISFQISAVGEPDLVSTTTTLFANLTAYAINGEIDNVRQWEEYKNGFEGDEGFWLGLDMIHQLTSSASYKLRMEGRSKDGNMSWVEWSTFRVADESDDYRLTVSGYNDNSTLFELDTNIPMLSFDQMPFTTMDRDNDNCDTCNMAEEMRLGWWWNDWTDYMFILMGEEEDEVRNYMEGPVYVEMFLVE